MPIEDRIREALDACMARVRNDMDPHVRSLTSDLLRLTREVRMDAMERLLTAARRIDEAESLSAILDALIHGAAVETSRVAVLLVSGDHLKVWGHRGFVDGAVPTDLPIAASSPVAAAIEGHQVSVVPPLTGDPERAFPAFMSVPVGSTGAVFPIVVGGAVVAVLYADDVERTAAQEEAPIWNERIELLVRRASICLETVTSARTVEVLARPG